MLYFSAPLTSKPSQQTCPPRILMAGAGNLVISIFDMVMMETWPLLYGPSMGSGEASFVDVFLVRGKGSKSIMALTAE